MQQQLGGGLAKILGAYDIRFFIGNYYHPALFFQCLGIPSYLYSLNDFYRQKANALTIPAKPIDEFLAMRWEEHQQRLLQFREFHDNLRYQWRGHLDSVLTKD